MSSSEWEIKAWYTLVTKSTVAETGDKSATTWIRQLVAVDIVTNSVDFVANTVYFVARQCVAGLKFNVPLNIQHVMLDRSQLHCY